MSLVTNVSNFIFSLYLKTQKEVNFSIFLNFFIDTSLGRQILDLPFLDFNLTIIKTLVGSSSLFLIQLKGIRNPQSFLFPKQSHINKWSISSIINEQPLSLLLTLLFSSFQREGIFLLSNILKKHLNRYKQTYSSSQTKCSFSFQRGQINFLPVIEKQNYAIKTMITKQIKASKKYGLECHCYLKQNLH